MFRKTILSLIISAFGVSLACAQLVAEQAASAVSFSMLVPGQERALPTTNGPNQALPERPLRGIQIRLQQAVFDPLREPAGLLPELVIAEDDPSGGDYHLVQFRGPILTEWRAQLEGHGAVIMDYVPDFAYIVRADPGALRRIQSMQTVRWTGVLQPAFRLSNDLLDSIHRGRTDVAVELVVRGFAGEPEHRVAAALAARSAAISQQYADQGGGAIFRALVPEAWIADLAHVPEIAWIEPDYEPAFANSVARSSTIMNKDLVESELGLFGQGQIVAVGDSGLSTGNAATVHQDFAGRVIGGTWGSGTCGSWADANSHGTHVAGSVLGSGARSGADIPNQNYAGSHAGIAPEASLYVWSFCNNFSGLPTAPYANYYGAKYGIDPNLRISTNSWGYTGGFGQYNSFTRETDRFVRDFPDMVISYAAGNSAVDSNSSGVINPGSMAMPGTGKNVITVGASESLRMSGGLNPGGPCSTWGTCWPADFPANPISSDRISDNIDGMAAFSGRGPTLSGRLKPDVVAPGTNIVSARNESAGSGWGVFDAFYLYSGGTSMSTPLVAGAAAIIREFFDVEHSLNPSAALVKAMLINGAVDMTPGQYGTGSAQEVIRRPDNSQGWGRVSMSNSLLYNDPRALLFEEHAGLNTAQTHEVQFQVIDASVPLRVTLVWSDTQGTEASHGALVNDLDLELSGPGGALHIGNAIITGGTPDRNNNVEGVDLATPAVGSYTVTVRGFNVPSGPQPFALVVSGALGASEESFALGVDQASVSICAGDNAIYNVSLLSLEGFDDPVTLSLSTPPGSAAFDFAPNPVVPTSPAASSSLTISNTAGISSGSYPLTVTGQSNGPSFSEQEETLLLQLLVDAGAPDAPSLSSPGNGATGVAIDPVLSWSAVPGAGEYELQVATDAAFNNIVVQTSTAATSLAVSLNSDTTYFWRVRAGNGCGNGGYSSSFSFTTTIQICSAPGSTIPTNASVADSIVLSSSDELTDLQVSLQLQKDWVGDLIVTLEHVESGTQIDLINRPGVSGSSQFGCSIADIDVLFDDGAGVDANDICNGSSPAISGVARPVGSLSDFFGEAFGGEWILTVTDTQDFEDPGTLQEWCLIPALEPADNPVPVLATIDPASTPVGSADTQLTATGSDFATDAVVRFSGVDLATTFVSNSELNASIPTAALTAAGTVDVTVFNPAPGGGSSSAIPFEITQASSTTSITSIVPASQQVVGVDYTVNVSVSGYSPTGTVNVSDGEGGSCQITLPATSCALSSATVGPRTISASYAGDANNTASMDDEDYLIIAAESTTTITGIDPPDEQIRQRPYTVTVSVTGDNPSGTVIVDDGHGETCEIELPETSCMLVSDVMGVRTITASYAGDDNHQSSQDSAGYEILAGALAELVFEAQPLQVGVGEVMTDVVVRLLDDQGNLVDWDHSTLVQLALEDNPSGATLGGTTTQTVVGGEAVFSDLVLDQIGSAYSLRATTLSDAPLFVTDFVLDPGQVHQEPFWLDRAASSRVTGLSFSGEVEGISAGSTLASNLRMDVMGPSGSSFAVGGFDNAAPVSWSFDGASDDGLYFSLHVGIFDSLGGGGTLDHGLWELDFRHDWAASAQTMFWSDVIVVLIRDSFEVVSDPFDVIAGQPASLAFAVQPSNTEVFALISPAVTVQVLDSAGNLVDWDNSTEIALALAGSAALDGGDAITVSNGEAVFNALSVDLAGSGYRIEATADGLDAELSDSFDILQIQTMTEIISADPASSQVVGQPIMITVSVDGGNPTGEILVNFPTGDFCTITLPDDSCELVVGSVASGMINAGYSGDPNHQSSIDSIEYEILQASSETVITSITPPDQQTVNASYTVAVTVTGFNPTGTVDVDDGDGNGCQISLVGGSGSCALASDSVGIKSITASYGGDANNSASMGTEGYLIVAAASSTTIIAIDPPDSQTVGQDYTVTVSVSGDSPSGTVVVSDGDGSSCLVALPATSCALSSTTVGLKTISAEYQGDATNDPSSDAMDYEIVRASSVTTIAGFSPEGGQVVGEDYSVEVSVSGFAPTGTVEISDGEGGTCTISLPDTSCMLSSSTVGGKLITATYSGDDNNTPGSDEAAYEIVSSGPIALSFLVSPEYGVAGASLVPTIVVQVLDSLGQLVEDDNSTVIELVLETNPTGAVLSGPGSLTVSNGEAHFVGLSVDLAGSGYRLQAEDAAGELLPDTSDLFDVHSEDVFSDRFEQAP